MNREKDMEKFTKLMLTIEKITPGENVDPEAIEAYFRCTEDLSYELVEKNCFDFVRRKGFFPKVPDMRGENEQDLELKAQQDYIIICELVDNFVYPDFHQSGFNVIEMKLKKMNREDLLPLANRWGYELVYSTNPTATRAQFLKAYKAEIDIERRGLPPGEQGEQIDQKAEKLLDGVIKEV